MGNVTKELKNLKNRGFTIAKIKYEKIKSSKTRKHRVLWKDLEDTWLSRESNNRLDTTWRAIPTRWDGIEEPFELEKIEVKDGTGEVKVKWTIWDDSKKLENNEVELYSVMRAEEYYIEQGFTKLASKWYWMKYGKIPIENCGVDSFFKKDYKYLVCESKFTRDESLYEEWVRNDEKVWQRLGSYKMRKKKHRQMSWVWLRSRASKAVGRPSGTRGLTPQKKAELAEECRLMRKQIRKKRVKRVVNVYGLESVPIYPGKYRFRSGEKGKISENTLTLKWDLEINDKEFIVLGARFDRWAKSKIRRFRK